MARELIDRYALIKDMYEDGYFPLTVADKATEKVMAQPTVDAAPVVHGEWIGNGIPESVLSGCSVCGYSCGSSSFNYCPNCGADMRGEKNASD